MCILLSIMCKSSPYSRFLLQIAFVLPLQIKRKCQNDSTFQRKHQSSKLVTFLLELPEQFYGQYWSVTWCSGWLDHASAVKPNLLRPRSFTLGLTPSSSPPPLTTQICPIVFGHGKTPNSPQSPR